MMTSFGNASMNFATSIRRNTPQTALGAGLLCFIGLLAAGIAVRGQGTKSPEAAEGQPEASKQLKPFYIGVNACAKCHNQSEPVKDAVCRCIEVGIWQRTDKHQDTYKALSGKLGKQMAGLLRKDVLKRETGCLACHAVDPPDKQQADPTFNLEEGVSCVVCHGPFDEWIEAHTPIAQPRKEKWRELPRQKKEQLYGMTDLWDPARRTSVCVSCHVGNFQQRKFVTHEMFAAGHPPLPGMEIATFSEQMPPHWQNWHTKGPNVRHLQGLDSKPEQLEQLELVAVSSLKALRQTLLHLASQAEHCVGATNPDDRVLDFANFDCYACHHDLKSKSWRQQERGYVGTPGRPQMSSSPIWLARTTLEVMKDELTAKALHDGLKNVYSAFSQQPFGNCPEIKTTARALACQLKPWIKELGTSDAHYDKAAAERYLRKLCASPRGRRQIIRTLRIMTARPNRMGIPGDL